MKNKVLFESLNEMPSAPPGQSLKNSISATTQRWFHFDYTGQTLSRQTMAVVLADCPALRRLLPPEWIAQFDQTISTAIQLLQQQGKQNIIVNAVLESDRGIF
jgi:hypothetical protein